MRDGVVDEDRLVDVDCVGAGEEFFFGEGDAFVDGDGDAFGDGGVFFFAVVQGDEGLFGRRGGDGAGRERGRVGCYGDGGSWRVRILVTAVHL